MYNHAPAGYVCPFCLIISEVENEHVWTVQNDSVYRDEMVTAFISARQWPNNRGHVLIVPNAHHENIYELPDDLALGIHAAARKIALALKAAYGCEGVSTRQHNEPAGNQDVWHYHLHVFPRYTDDDLYFSHPLPTAVEERAPYTEKLRKALSE